MSDSSDLSDQELDYCQNQLRKAKRYWRGASEILDESAAAPSYSNLISDCQQAIEQSAKIMFRLVGEEPPSEHEIDFETGQKLLRSEFPDRFNRESNLPRVIFLTQFWSEFYLPAKYGDEKFGIAADDLFKKEDAELAVSHARFCYRTATSLFESARWD